MTIVQLQQCLPLVVLKRADEPAYQEPEYSLQQCLPLAVLKRYRFSELMIVRVVVATVPTVCGIETLQCRECNSAYLHTPVATVPTACGIETALIVVTSLACVPVATALTACGIETCQTQYKLFQVLDLVATVLTACGIESF